MVFVDLFFNTEKNIRSIKLTNWLLKTLIISQNRLSFSLCCPHGQIALCSGALEVIFRYHGCFEVIYFVPVLF